MIGRLLRFALRQRFITLLLAGGLIVLGIWSFRRLKIEAYPDISDTGVVVITLFPGHAAEEVEQQVTIPIERSPELMCPTSSPGGPASSSAWRSSS